MRLAVRAALLLERGEVGVGEDELQARAARSSRPSTFARCVSSSQRTPTASECATMYAASCGEEFA